MAGAILLPMASLTGCMEETVPTQYVTQEQVIASPKAAESYAMGMPAFLLQPGIVNLDWSFDLGYPGMMHIRDLMTGDMAMVYTGYDHFRPWELATAMGESYAYPQIVWNTYCQLVQTANLTIEAIDPEDETPIKRYYYGAALAFRAMAYLDMARWYEFLPNDMVEPVNSYGNNVLNLTVPIVTPEMTEDEARVNPRATRQEMLDFLIESLTTAEDYITATTRPNKTMPDLAVVYGLKARAYMWVEDYAKAKEYAAKAIAAHSGTPTTEEQWLSTTNGFNTLSTPSWMWGTQYTADMDVVTLASIYTWTSWACNEFEGGYAGVGARNMIDAALYKSISDEDFRKLTFVAPKGSALEGKENFVDKNYLDDSWSWDPLQEYASLKFKPGQGDMVNDNPGVVTSYPLMRIEEMYLIEAEAAAHSNAAEGKTLLENFMKNYRYSSYTCPAGDVVDEIFKQKRIEFYGEGIIFFDYKRLNKSVTRHYEGTNWASAYQFNTNGRPAWMNYVIVQTEGNSNSAVREFNNPDPSDKYVTLGE